MYLMQKKITDKDSDSMQLICKKSPHVEFCCSVKAYPQWSEMAPFMFSSDMSVWGQIFFIYLNQNNSLQQMGRRAGVFC